MAVWEYFEYLLYFKSYTYGLHIWGGGGGIRMGKYFTMCLSKIRMSTKLSFDYLLFYTELFIGRNLILFIF